MIALIIIIGWLLCWYPSYRAMSKYDDEFKIYRDSEDGDIAFCLGITLLIAPISTAVMILWLAIIRPISNIVGHFAPARPKNEDW